MNRRFGFRSARNGYLPLIEFEQAAFKPLGRLRSRTGCNVPSSRFVRGRKLPQGSSGLTFFKASASIVFAFGRAAFYHGTMTDQIFASAGNPIPEHAEAGLFEGKGGAVEQAFDCRAFVCRLPVSDPSEMALER